MNDHRDTQPYSGLTTDSEMEAVEPQPSKWRIFFKELIDTVVLALVLFVIINALTARVRVDGPSMEPSFVHNNRVVVSKVTYMLGDIERGDVIVFPAPPNPDEDYIKRVIGLPGDEIQVQGGQVIVNGEVLNEPYISAPPISEMRPMEVPEGQVFVMGDNRNVSSDSRSWGPLPIDDVIGKAIFVYWPLERIHVIEHYELGGDS